MKAEKLTTKKQTISHLLHKLVLASVASLLALSLTACASTRSAGDQLDDAALTSRVKTKLAADPEVNPFNIDVDSTDGVVTLSGTVDDRATREEAGELASNTGGVVRVINDITVGERSLGEGVGDAAIVTKVKAKLTADPEINPFNIDVDSNQGVVTLSGTVAKAEARQEAERLARNTSGVKSVKNRIEVERGGD